MKLVDIDVCAIGAAKDRVIKVFRDALKRQAGLAKAFGMADRKMLIDDAATVYHMVQQIVAKIGARRIRRLRIFGHGSDNIVLLSPLLPTYRSPDWSEPTIQPSDFDKVIGGKPGKWDTPEGRVKEGYVFYNEAPLKKLSGLFDPRGWVELHSCRIAGDVGKQLIKALAMLWQVEVRASEDTQFVGGGLEGKVWVAKPWGKPSPASWWYEDEEAA